MKERKIQEIGLLGPITTKKKAKEIRQLQWEAHHPYLDRMRAHKFLENPSRPLGCCHQLGLQH